MTTQTITHLTHKVVETGVIDKLSPFSFKKSTEIVSGIHLICCVVIENYIDVGQFRSSVVNV